MLAKPLKVASLRLAENQYDARSDQPLEQTKPVYLGEVGNLAFARITVHTSPIRTMGNVLFSVQRSDTAPR